MMNDIITYEGGAPVLAAYASQQIAQFEKSVKELRAAEDKLKADILAAMEEHGILSLDTPEITITYVSESVRETLDTKAIKAEYPELYDAYAKASPVKASVRIKVKDHA